MAIWQSAPLRPEQAAGQCQGPGQPPQTCRPLSGCTPITAPNTSRSGFAAQRIPSLILSMRLRR